LFHYLIGIIQIHFSKKEEDYWKFMIGSLLPKRKINGEHSFQNFDEKADFNPRKMQVPNFKPTPKKTFFSPI
jgi:hypothetical protein